MEMMEMRIGLQVHKMLNPGPPGLGFDSVIPELIVEYQDPPCQIESKGWWKEKSNSETPSKTWKKYQEKHGLKTKFWLNAIPKPGRWGAGDMSTAAVNAAIESVAAATFATFDLGAIVKKLDAIGIGCSMMHLISWLMMFVMSMMSEAA